MKTEQWGIIKCGDVFKEYCHLFLFEKILIKNLQKHKSFYASTVWGDFFCVVIFPPKCSLSRSLHLLTLPNAWAISLSHHQITSEKILPQIFQNVPNVPWSQSTSKELYKVLRSHRSTYIKQWCMLCKIELNWNESGINMASNLKSLQLLLQQNSDNGQ